MIKYKKLVRDRIPEIIKENGEKTRTRKLGPNEFEKVMAKAQGRDKDRFASK